MEKLSRQQRVKKALLTSGKTFAGFSLLVLIYIYIYIGSRTMRLPSGKGLVSLLFVYIAYLVPFVCLGIWVLIKHGKSRTTWKVLFLFGISYLLRILLADFISIDYISFLKQWLNQYRGMSIRQCFAMQVGNYTPFYNYFLILFSRLPIYDLYLIKILSFYFEVLTAIFVMKLIAKIKATQVNPLHLAITLILLIPLLNSSQWAQCDTIYAFFAVAGIYYAINRQSALCFIMMGIGFAIKMQMLFIYPVVLILLTCRNPKGEKYLLWKHIWLAPLAFSLINLGPFLFGGSLFRAIDAYINQIFVGNPGEALCVNCANAFLWLSGIKQSSPLYPILSYVFVGVVALLLTVLIVAIIKSMKNRLENIDVLMLAVFIPLIAVFFLPKMHDRFFYLAEIFMFVYLMVSNNNGLIRSAYLALELGVLITYMSFLQFVNFWIWWVANLFTGFCVIVMFVVFMRTLKNKPLKNKPDVSLQEV